MLSNVRVEAHGEKDGGYSQQQGEKALAMLEAERQDGSDQKQGHQPVKPRPRQAEAKDHRRARKQRGEDHEQDAKPALCIRPPPISPLRFWHFGPRHQVALRHASR
jgi:hypothetical protein